MPLEIIHVGNVCQPCAEDWRQIYRKQYEPHQVVVTCYETNPNDCEECEGDSATDMATFNESWDAAV